MSATEIFIVLSLLAILGICVLVCIQWNRCAKKLGRNRWFFTLIGFLCCVVAFCIVRFSVDFFLKAAVESVIKNSDYVSHLLLGVYFASIYLVSAAALTIVKQRLPHKTAWLSEVEEIGQNPSEKQNEP